jgi:bifunctional non-homologous end joining protein LigD
MPLARLHAPFDHADCIFEPKMDGFRALAYVQDGACRLVSRNRNTYKSFPELTTAIEGSLRVRNAILDGEIVHLDAAGVPQFYDLMRRRRPQHFFAFDLVWMNGRDLRALPLIERKRLLRGIVRPQPAPVLYVDHVAERGVALFEAICARDMEGVVAKLASAPYTPEATTWVKIKNRAYSHAEGRAEFFHGRAASTGAR